MKFPWKYPLYLIPLGGGYVSVVDADAGGGQRQLLAVFTDEQAANAFAAAQELGSSPRPLHNAREFAWLLQSLRAPVTRVAFDPHIDEQRVTHRWAVGVRELLEQHLTVDGSPWNYPVFVVAHDDGYASIDGQASDGRAVQAVCFFTQREKAESYLQQIGQPGRVQPLEDLRAARDLIEQLAPTVAAVALDPVINAGRHTAKYCFPIPTLLDKYLKRKGE